MLALGLMPCHLASFWIGSLKITGTGFLSPQGAAQAQQVANRLAPILDRVERVVGLCDQGLAAIGVAGHETPEDNQRVIACMASTFAGIDAFAPTLRGSGAARVTPRWSQPSQRAALCRPSPQVTYGATACTLNRVSGSSCALPFPHKETMSFRSFTPKKAVRSSSGPWSAYE